MRIAWVSETFLPKVDGVVTRLTATLEALEAQGHEVLVIAPPGGPERYAGQRVVGAWGFPFPWYPEHTAAFPRPGLGRELARFEPDVVHAINPVLFGAWGVGQARARRLPLVASFHTDPKVLASLGLGWFRGPMEWIDRRLHNCAHLTLCPSPQMLELVRRLGVRRARLWPKGVDTRRFRPEARGAQMRARLTAGEPDAPLLLYAGRLAPEKGLELLAEALPELPGARLAFVGDGPSADALRERFAGTPTVFTGWLDGEELAAAYASADLFVFPSEIETLGLAALEAFASGVPVVGARAGGLVDVIDDGETGRHFAPGDAADLIRVLRPLLERPAERERMARAARATALRLDWDSATRALVDAYRRAIRVRRIYG